MTPLARMENASRLYRGGRGAKNITLSIHPGEIVGLLGPNGSGKTTLMKLLCGLCRPDTGRVEVDGVSVTDDPARALKRVGALIEAPALYDDLSARANLRAIKLYTGAITNADVERALNWVGMAKYANEKCKRLSLGMKQRVGLAMAFLGDIKLLVLDEPMNGLDIDGALEVRGAIRTACRETGAAALISSHAAPELEKLCDRAALMREGEIIAYESMNTILSECASLEDFYLARTRGGERIA